MDDFNEFKEWFDKDWDLETKEKFEELKNKYSASTEEEKEKIQKQMKDIIANQYGYYIFGIANENISMNDRLNNIVSNYLNLENSVKNSIDADVVDWLIYCISSNLFDYENMSNLNKKLVNKLKHECLLIKNEQTNEITKINYPKALNFIKKFEVKYSMKLSDNIFNKLELLINDELKDFLENLDKDVDAVILVTKKFKIEKYEAIKLIDKFKRDSEYKIKVVEDLINGVYDSPDYLDSSNDIISKDPTDLINQLSKDKDIYLKIDNLSEEELNILFEYILEENNEGCISLLSSNVWRRILEKIFELKYNVLVKDLDSINVLYDILLDNYKEMKQINLQFKRIPLNQEKYNKLQKIFRDNFENIYKTLNNIDIMEEELFGILNPNINSKLLSYAWNNIVKSKLETYGKNDEKLMEFNELLENHLRYSLNIKDTETYLDELFNDKNIFNDVSNYDKIISVIEGIIFREKINNNYFLENENKTTVGVNENETASYLHVHEEYLKRLNDWQKNSPLFRPKKLSELDVAIEELEKQKRL